MSEFILRELLDFSDEEKINKFDKLYSKVEEYINYVNSDNFHADNDFEHYLYENLITIIASSEFWDWYNSKV